MTETHSIRRTAPAKVNSSGVIGQDRRQVLTWQGWAVLSFLGIFSIIPSSLQPLISLPPLYAHLINILIVIIGGLAYVFASIGLLRVGVQGIIPLSWLLLAQAIIGVTTSPYLYAHGIISLLFPIWTLIFTPLCAVVLVKYTKASSTDFIYGLALVIAMVSVEYIAASVIGPLLGFRGGNPTSLGDNRISGSLANAATLQLVLVPALSVFLEHPTKRYASLGTIACAAGLIFTFSRASAIALMAYLTYYFIFGRTSSWWARIGLILSSAIVISGVLLIAEPALRDRLADLTDSARSLTVDTTIRAWEDRPFWGQGYSQLWPWWQRAGELSAGLRRDRWDGLVVNTNYGATLWNPHSLILAVGGELGIVGLVVTGLMTILLARRLVLIRRTTGLGIALVISATVDCITAGTFYTYAFTGVVWWLFALSIIYDTARDSAALSRIPKHR
jgi:O-antigen ligase